MGSSEKETELKEISSVSWIGGFNQMIISTIIS